MIENREARRAAARQAGPKNKRKALTAVATSGLLVSPMLTNSANALAGPVVTACTTGIGTGDDHNLGWAIDQINNGNGEGLNYGPIGTTITFDLDAPCTLNVTGLPGAVYTITESMNIQGPGEDEFNIVYGEGGLGAFRIDANAANETFTTAIDVTIHGLSIDGQDQQTDLPAISVSDYLGPATITVDHVDIHDINITYGEDGTGAIHLENVNSVDNDSSLTITNSEIYANSQDTGAVRAENAPITIEDSSFHDNYSEGAAGAIFANGSTVAITDSTFENNWGAAAGVATSESATVSGSTFISNGSEYGPGAIYGYSFVNTTNSMYTNNWSEGANGGAISSNISIYAESSTFNGNTAQSDGGAIWVNGQMIGLNNTFVSNISNSGNGGAIWAEGGSIDSSTFSDNRASLSGDAISTPGTVSIYANIFDRTLATENSTCDGTFDNRGANLGTDNCGDSIGYQTYSSEVKDVSAIVTREQLDLQELALNTTSPTNTGVGKTIALGPNSVARDYYSAAPQSQPQLRTACLQEVNCELMAAPDLDQRGVSRPQGARNDVGAYEAYVATAPNAATCVPVSMSAIKFKANSAKLTKAARKSLLNTVRKTKASGCHTVVLNGYTAKVSNGADHKAFRKMLAKKRNAAVKKYLKKQFAKANYDVTFETHAFGAADAKASNKTAKGREKNRRVEIVIKKLRGINF